MLEEARMLPGPSVACPTTSSGFLNSQGGANITFFAIVKEHCNEEVEIVTSISSNSSLVAFSENTLLNGFDFYNVLALPTM